MAKPPRFETPPTDWAGVHAGYPDEIVRLTKEVRAVVVDALPECQETVQGARMMGYAQYWQAERNDVLAMISPEDEHVKLYVHHVKKDATGALKVEGTGKNARHVKLRPADGLPEAAIRALLAQVVEARAAAAATNPATS
ncbi:MAG: DUF1801 domain-containing protein [Thermoplasmatota archaeon]